MPHEYSSGEEVQHAEAVILYATRPRVATSSSIFLAVVFIGN
jgi:hypothetical protein